MDSMNTARAGVLEALRNLETTSKNDLRKRESISISMISAHL